MSVARGAAGRVRKCAGYFGSGHIAQASCQLRPKRVDPGIVQTVRASGGYVIDHLKSSFSELLPV